MQTITRVLLSQMAATRPAKVWEKRATRSWRGSSDRKSDAETADLRDLRCGSAQGQSSCAAAAAGSPLLSSSSLAAPAVAAARAVRLRGRAGVSGGDLCSDVAGAKTNTRMRLDDLVHVHIAPGARL